jgi:signal transduction histidine kinase
MFRNSRLLLLVALLCVIAVTVTLFVQPRSWSETDNSIWGQFSLSQLEQRIAAIDKQVQSLSRPSMRSTVGAVGSRSQVHATAEHQEWIQIDLAETALIDEVVLVPAIWRDALHGFRADGFPLEFRILVGSGDEDAGTIVKSFTKQDGLLPRVAPVVISFPPIEASWVRLEASVLSPRGWDGKYVLQLSELLVFSDQENVALQQTVQVSSSSMTEKLSARHRDYLVDGFVPYLMDASVGNQSLTFLRAVGEDESPTITFDLNESLPISRVHLHAVDVSDTVPQTQPEDFGMPRHFVLVGAHRPDFSDAMPLTEYHLKSTYDAGPIIVRRFPETECRYVQVRVIEPYTDALSESREAWVGFAEIEIFSRGKNVALGKIADVNLSAVDKFRGVAALTDGNHLFGRILPMRDWLEELATRHDLESERPFVQAELSNRYQHQRNVVRLLSWLSGLLVLIAVCVALIDRIALQRAIKRVRERIAADLHDEIGANLHAIGLLGDLAQSVPGSPEKVKLLMQRIRAMTDRSGAATRQCANMLESQGLFGDLLDDMQRLSARMMADFEHDISFEGESFLRQLKPSIRVDLFLFYKECLTNILRHSHASRVSTLMQGTKNEVRLVVTDNGCGLQNSIGNQAPPSLNRRVRLFGASVSTHPIDGGGTSVRLVLRTKTVSWWR